MLLCAVHRVAQPTDEQLRGRGRQWFDKLSHAEQFELSRQELSSPGGKGRESGGRFLGKAAEAAEPAAVAAPAAASSSSSGAPAPPRVASVAKTEPAQPAEGPSDRTQRRHKALLRERFDEVGRHTEYLIDIMSESERAKLLDALQGRFPPAQYACWSASNCPQRVCIQSC